MNTLKAIRKELQKIGRRLKLHLGMLKRRIVAPKIPTTSHGKVLVNLGAGPTAHPDFINIDTRPYSHIHFIHTVEELPMFTANSVDLLYASHLVEHIDRQQLPITLREWLRALKPGGTLRFGVPNFDSLIGIYEKSGRDIESMVNQLLGQGAPYDDHHTIWNFNYAKKLLESCGYTNVRTWDPATAEYHGMADKTLRAAELGGETFHISLNIEASKPAH